MKNSLNAQPRIRVSTKSRGETEETVNALHAEEFQMSLRVQTKSSIEVLVLIPVSLYELSDGDSDEAIGAALRMMAETAAGVHALQSSLVESLLFTGRDN